MIMKYYNNPLNIRFSESNNWLGMIEPKNGFCQFKFLACGIRAALIIMHNYILSGHDTLPAIIKRWCPRGDGNNNPDAYYKMVSDYMFNKFNFRPSSTKVLSKPYKSPSFYYMVLSAMCKVECGMSYLSPIDFDEGFDLYMHRQTLFVDSYEKI